MTSTPTETAATEEPRRVEPAVSAGPPTFRMHLAHSRALLVLGGLVILAVFLPALVVPYAFSDDYPVLSIAVGFASTPQFGSSIIDTAAASGRPFAGLLDHAAFRLAGTIDNLRFVRLVGVLGIAGLALLLHWFLVRARLGRMAAAVIAVLVCTLPAFQVYGSWAVLFNVPYAALLAGGASALAVAAAVAPANLKLDRLVGSTGLLLGALLIYQPAAMFFWVFLAVALLGAAGDRELARRIVRMHGVAAVALPIAFAIAKLAIDRVGDRVPNPDRNSLVHDVGGKLHWFFTDPLKRALNLFDITPSWWLALVVATVAVAGLPLLLRRRGAPLWPSLGVAAALIPLAYLPNLAVEENSATYRTLIALSALIALYAALGALGLWLEVRDRLGARLTSRGLAAADRAAATAAVVFVAACCVVAVKNITQLFVDPQMTELRLLRGEVADVPDGAGRVAFVGTSYREGIEKVTVGDEFGIPSTSQAFVAQPVVMLLLREEGRLQPGGPEPQVDTFLWYETQFPRGEPVIDVRRQLRSFR